MLRARTVAIAVAAISLTAGAMWHLRPSIVWRITIAPQLELHNNASRLQAASLASFPEPPPDWSLLETPRLSLRVPIPDDSRAACLECATGCLIQIPQGTVAILADEAPASYTDTLDLWTPDRDDLSVLRPARQNWQTIEALVHRVERTGEGPESFRFSAARSKGVVIVHRGPSGERFVIYAYSRDGAAARVVGLTGLSRGDMQRVLGTLSVDANSRAPASGRTASSCS